MFVVLDQIRRHADKTQMDWAYASGMAQSRIAELNQLAKGKRKPGVRCTVDKIVTLYNGLEKILGRVHMRKAILEKMRVEVDPKVQLMMIALTLNDTSIKKLKDIAEMIAKSENNEI